MNLLIRPIRAFPGGPVVKIPPSNEGGEGLIPGQGLGSHMLYSESKKKRCQRVDENDVREE